MAFLQWRRFNFFDKDIVKDPESGQPLDKLKDIVVSCSTSGRGQLVFGDKQGHIHFISRQFQLSSFKAFEITVTHIEQLRENAILVAVGEDEPHTKVSSPLVKIWNTDKLDPLGKPVCLRIIRSTLVIDSHVTAFAVHENLTLLALGFDNSSILLIRGDLTRERQSKPKVIEVGSSKVTGIAFRTLGKTVLMFAVTENEVYSFTFAAKDKETRLLMDSHGCSPKCSVLSDMKQDFQFVIGRGDAVYFYQRDGRGPCLAFEGEKVILHWFKSYLVVVGKDEKAMMPMAALKGNSSKPAIRNMVTVYDILNKFIAYYSIFPAVIDVVSEWGSIYILLQDGKMFKLQEKDTQSKLDMLFKKNQYSLAISLAKIQQYDVDGLVDIFRQYGDHLYSKGDHDGAVAQYKKTIGKLEASYVIRKFLDAQRIHNLTDYLQSLHKMGLASADHTTLLLNCYTKLKDIDKLNEFIMTKDKEVDFDVEIAMKVCRQAGYYKHALYLAEKHQQHDWYLKIQMEDLKDCETALAYMTHLDASEQESNMKKYGKVLMMHAPEKTAAVLKELCSGQRSGALGSPTDARAVLPSAQDFIHIFDKNSELLMDFLEHIQKIPSQSSDLVFSTLLELYLHSYNHEADFSERKNVRQQIIMEILKNSDTQYNVDQALVLCKINNFKPGILYLYEKSKLYQHILHFHMKNHDYESVVQTCSNFGDTDPNLWVQALWFFCKFDQNQKDNISRVLRAIEENNLLSPILVIEIMSKSHTATLDFIKDYVRRYLQKENEQISEDERLIRQYKEETEKMRSQIEDLKKNAKVFQVSRCSACNHQLELPTVHFLCNHSYHQQCFENYSAENDSECPKCLPENRQVLDIIRSQEQHKDRHEQFHHELDREVDSFSFVADYFGRGVFNKVTFVVDSSKPAEPLLPS